MNVIENIQRIRGEKRISQAEMAEKLGIAQNNYGKIERGITELTVERLYKIAEILSSSPSELLGLEITKSEEKNQIKENENDKKTEGLEKRIAELESRIKDKESIILYKEEISERNFEFLEKIIAHYTHTKAKEYGLMTYTNIEYEGKYYLALKGKLENIIPISEQNRFQYKEHLAIEDLEDTIELVQKYDNEFARLVYNLAYMIESSTQIGQCWRDLIKHKSSSDYHSPKKKPKINNEVVDVSEKHNLRSKS